TGYVSGISYGYKGVIIKGAKLGNDFKWSSIKSGINYDQVRDREVIQQINAKVESRNGDTKVTPAQQKDGLLYKTSESSKSLIPTSLGDGHPLENLIHADPQPEIDIEKVLKLRKNKKRRRGLRH